MSIDPAKLALYVSFLSLVLSVFALGANIGKLVKGTFSLGGWCSDSVWLWKVKRALPDDNPKVPPHPPDSEPWLRGERNHEVRWFVVNHPRRHRAVERGKARGYFAVEQLEDGRLALGPLPVGTPPMSLRQTIIAARDEVEQRNRRGRR